MQEIFPIANPTEIGRRKPIYSHLIGPWSILLFPLILIIRAMKIINSSPHSSSSSNLITIAVDIFISY